MIVRRVHHTAPLEMAPWLLHIARATLATRVLMEVFVLLVLSIHLRRTQGKGCAQLAQHLVEM